MPPSSPRSSPRTPGGARGVASPTCRFSVLRMTVHGWPCRCMNPAQNPVLDGDGPRYTYMNETRNETNRWPRNPWRGPARTSLTFRFLRRSGCPGQVRRARVAGCLRLRQGADSCRRCRHGCRRRYRVGPKPMTRCPHRPICVVCRPGRCGECGDGCYPHCKRGNHSEHHRLDLEYGVTLSVMPRFSSSRRRLYIFGGIIGLVILGVLLISAALLSASQYAALASTIQAIAVVPAIAIAAIALTADSHDKRVDRVLDFHKEFNSGEVLGATVRLVRQPHLAL